MTVLIIGLGSIGQRHLRNLRALYGDSIRICAFRERNLRRLLNNKGEIVDGVLEEEYNVIVYQDLDQCLRQENVDVVIVSTITAKHIEYAIKVVEAGCNVFIEKPLSNTADRTDELLEKARMNNVIAQVGFQLRYHPGVKLVKELISSKQLKNIFAAEFWVGERVSKMHLYEDYKNTYIVTKEMGGGIVLNQQIHEIDLMLYLLGSPQKVFGVTGKLDSVTSDVEDRADAMYIYNNNMVVSIHSDFATYPPQRKFTIKAENGTVEVDIINNTVKYSVDGEKTKNVSFVDFERNDMFMEEMSTFIDDVRFKNIRGVSLDEGIQSLKIALATLKSSSIKEIEYIE